MNKEELIKNPRKGSQMKMDYKEIYDRHWKEAVEDESGNLDKDKVMRELSDYWFVLGEVPKVYCHVSGNRISKPNTYASEVISEADEHYTSLSEETAIHELLQVYKETLNFIDVINEVCFSPGVLVGRKEILDARTKLLDKIDLYTSAASL